MRKLILLLALVINSFILAQNGTLDTTFNASSISTYPGGVDIRRTAIYSNNDVICVGKFRVNGVAHTIAKFNSSGALITSYPLTDVFTDTSLGTITSIVIQPDKKVIISGVFNKYGTITNFSNGNAIKGLIRINIDGSLDQTFAPDLSFIPAQLMASNKILLNALGDVFVTYPITTMINGSNNNRSLIKISSLGIIDTTFKNNSPIIIGNAFLDFEFQSTGKIVAVGSFYQNISGVYYKSVIRYNTDGTIDTSFLNSTSFIQYHPASGMNYNASIGKIEVFNDDSIFVSGNFNRINGNIVNSYGKLTSEGDVDLSYNTNSDFSNFNVDFSDSNSTSNAIYRPVMVQEDQKVLIALKDMLSGKSQVFRLDANGNVDNCFYKGQFSNNVSSVISDINIYPTGKILVSGSFNKFNTVTRTFLARLNNAVTVIKANNNTFNFNGCVTNTSSVTVQSNDFFNGLPFPASLSGFNLSNVGSVSPIPSSGGINLNADGTITVLSGTPDGTYVLSYQICQSATCGSCSNIGTVTIVVSSFVTPELISIDDALLFGLSGGITINSVFDFVTIGGVQANATNATIHVESALPSGITINADGTISIASGVAPGSYNSLVSYHVCQKCLPGNCSESRKIYLEVDVVANEDYYFFTSNGVTTTPLTTGVFNVLQNDSYLGATINPSQVLINYPSNSYYSIDTNPSSLTFGQVTINYPLPAGPWNYDSNYTVCLLNNPTICSQATIKLICYSANKMVHEEVKEIDYKTAEIEIFPNPTSGTLNINLREFSNQRFDLKLYNSIGQIVLVNNNISDTAQIDLSTFKNGVYFLQLQNENKTINKVIYKN